MKHIPVEVYGIIVHITDNHADMLKHYREEKKDPLIELDFDCSGHAWHCGRDFYIGVYDSGPECLDTLAHEIGHTMLEVCRYISYTPIEEQEPFCFLQGYITKKCLFALPKFKEAMNESVGTRAGNGGRRASKGDGSHHQQRGSRSSPQQPVCPSGVPKVRDSAVGVDPDVPQREEARRPSKR